MTTPPAPPVAHGEPLARRMPALDALRGLAVVLVLIYHLHEYVPLLWGGRTAFPIGGTASRSLGFLWIGVDLFYVLSGFFIGMAVLRPRDWQPMAFIRGRLTRILPAYYVSLVLIVAVLEPALASQLKGWINILLHVLMLHSLQEWTMFSINGRYWTLGIEFGFYLLMLALGPVLRLRRGWIVLVLMCAVCFLWRVNLLVGVAPGQRFFWGVQIFGMLDEFALGIALAMLHHRGWLDRLADRPIRAGGLLLVLGCLLIAGCFWYFLTMTIDYWSNPWTVLFSRTVLCLGFSLWIAAFLVLSRERWFNRCAQATGLPWIGKVSFSVYLYHVPVILVMHRAAETWLPGPGWMASVVAITLLVSYASHRWVEQRWHRSA